jgi:hypothetical protein
MTAQRAEPPLNKSIEGQIRLVKIKQLNAKYKIRRIVDGPQACRIRQILD